MICVVTIVRYPKFMGYFGILSMALFHLPLMFNKRVSFYKLLGCGKNGTFDIHPDWRQWAMLTVSNKELAVSNSGFISCYIRFFKCKTQTIVLKPVSSHGSWNGKKVFDSLPHITNEIVGRIAVLTRATIRLNKLKSFWKNVPDVSEQMKDTKGLIASFGIGEVPFIKQATLSIWDDVESMKTFAYQMKSHQTVIQKTRKENWYSEEMFTRFEVISMD